MTDEYLKHPSISRSDLKDILTSPSYFYLKNILKILPKKRTEAMDLGSIMDLAVLDQKSFYETYELITELKLRFKDYNRVKERCQWKEIKQENGYVYFDAGKSISAQNTLRDRLSEYYGKSNIILPETANKINLFLSTLYNHPIVNQLLHDGFDHHHSAFAKIEDVDCKCEYDLVDLKNHTICDYKTTANAIDPFSYSKSMWKWCQDIQCYLYSQIYLANYGVLPKFYFILQSTVSGQVIVYLADQDVYDSGERRTKLALEIFKRCMATGEWPEYIDPDTGGTNNDQVHLIHMPAFYRG